VAVALSGQLYDGRRYRMIYGLDLYYWMTPAFRLHFGLFKNNRRCALLNRRLSNYNARLNLSRNYKCLLLYFCFYDCKSPHNRL
jgi:hypothetical protein